MSAPLQGIRVFDLSRILAGPTATQILGDLGADVIKIERPGQGDDTRKWGPPFVKDAEGKNTTESGYYLSVNRNKRSVTLDIAQPEGQEIAKRLIAKSDIFVENFKVGDMAKYNLAYEQIKYDFPRLIYCSITGFGQTGPYAHRAGYDFLAQGMGGIMSVTGDPSTPPVKIGVAATDIITGIYATTGILAALHHRTASGRGQYIDMSLLDSQVSYLANIGLHYLTSGEVPKRLGNEHPNIVPYSVVKCADGFFILAVGNDSQFEKFCSFAGMPDWAKDPRFATNPARVQNRVVLYEMINKVTVQHPQKHWIEGLEALSVPCGPVNNVDQVFADPQVLHRNMKISMPYPAAASGHVDLIGSPLKLSETPVDYRLAPPTCGQDTDTVLREMLYLSDDDLRSLREKNVI
ncbi:CaiB/BaiF CoA-transferase family protein [Dongia soli]|uniref:CaiB/BaiF CoA-transferase family protein n=1 Tax=Dongia soli TaxID=600628 RepID=A0ABU5EH98_9PROT|nr:CaiB/BaiF CoA-transferase family protein [Dongia soli]MDY0885611.1 CaiB/BaiF CoA-transferase family protein [Dongia soli]